MRFLIDADAFLCLRKLRLLEWVLPRLRAPVVLGEYVARHELSTLDTYVRTLERDGLALVVAVSAGPARDRFRELRRAGADKGEAEALAWATLLSEEEFLFVSLDVRARREARGLRIAETDVMGFVVEAIAMGCLSSEEAKEATATWNDRKQEFCRPIDFDTFEETLKRRQARSRK